ncbi:hypothetical protein LRR81_01860 [Metabacillus sp. GX 13764]|uniref:hypothetical protein n=1 Tax=Metabacillus kandeliae TaxID=2900151 RepID=UPI001E42DB3E|nr:hypothetical protein [Metabacillus kandeliae]MCD7032957.1 hypothetical protein [Metabacillus kandeliae]
MIFSPMVVNIMGFKVNVIDRSGTFNVGTLQQIDYFLSIKQNQGFGEENGDLAPIYIPISSVLDSDLTDSNSIKNSVV